MIYAQDITIPAGTSASDPQKTSFKVNAGVIHQISLVFPAGCKGLARLQIFDGGHQFVPSTQDQYVSGDNEVFIGKEFYTIVNDKTRLVVHAWNLDDTYDHTLQLRLLILSKEELLPIGAYEGLLGVLRNVFLRGH